MPSERVSAPECRLACDTRVVEISTTNKSSAQARSFVHARVIIDIVCSSERAAGLIARRAEIEAKIEGRLAAASSWRHQSFNYQNVVQCRWGRGGGVICFCFNELLIRAAIMSVRVRARARGRFCILITM